MGLSGGVRWPVVAAATVVVGVALMLGWLFFAIGSCDYRFVYDRPAPSGRLLAELYHVDCGTGSLFEVVTLRDTSTVELPRWDGRPPGVIVTEDFDTTDRASEIFWDGETLVLQYGGVIAPDLGLAEWNGVRVETRQAER